MTEEKVRSKKLTRQFAKQLGSAEAEPQLLELAARLRASNPEGLGDAISILESLPRFFDNIDASYRDYDEQIQMAVRNLELSSSELTEANKSLELLNASVNALLDSLGQGVLFFDEKGICSPIFSKACLELLEANPAGKPITEVLKCDAAGRDSFQDLIDMLFTGQMALGFDELASMAPKAFSHSKGLSVALAYRPLYTPDGATLRAVVVIATDRTHEVEAMRLLAEKEARALRTLRIARNRNFFIRFTRQFYDLINSASSGELDALGREQIKRDIHTLKGTADTFQLAELGEKLHHLETALGVANAMPAALVAEHRDTLQTCFEESLHLAREVLGHDFEVFGKVHTISSQQLFAFAHTLHEGLRSGKSATILVELFYRTLAATPIWQNLEEFNVYLQELADRFGKSVAPCVFEGDNFVILPEIYESVFASLTHVARNIIDHGVEDAETRATAGKPAQATVTITTETTEVDRQPYFVVRIGDDGSGINTERLRAKLAKRPGTEKYLKGTDHQLIQAVFEDDVSTRDQVSALSGRGVGMSAVKAEVERLGGSVEMLSEPGKGATLVMRLPFIWQPGDL